jgi:site-specific DNA recombinase
LNAKVSTKLIDVAGYLRMSSDKQDTSLADQRKEITEYAAKHGYRVVRWYEDEGISGWKNKQRHGFHALINDAPGGDFRGVLCWDQSRFSRFSPMEANHFWYILSEANVWIETIKEGRLDFESLGGWLSASVQQHSKAEYCRSLAFDVVRGRRNQIAAGKWITCPPYGYRLNSTTGKLELGPAEEIEVVQRIFRLRADGLGRRLIVQDLTKNNVAPPRRGGHWNPSQIAAMLTRETYIGNMVIGKDKKGKFTHVTDEIIRFDNAHPAIIDRDLWNRVQAVKKEARPMPGRRSPTSGHLSGLIHCGICGNVMYIDRRKGYYVCSTYHSGRGCGHNTVTSTVALQLITDTIRETFLMGSVEKLTAHVERVLAKRKNSKTGIDSAAIKKQIAEIDRKLEAAAERMLEVEPSLVKSVRNAMLTLQEKRAALEEKLTSIQPAKKPQTAKQIAMGLWELNTLLASGDAIKVRAALSRIIEKVVIDFKLKPVGKEKRVYSTAAAATLFFCTECDNQSRRDGTFCTVPNKPIRVELATMKQSG